MSAENSTITASNRSFSLIGVNTCAVELGKKWAGIDSTHGENGGPIVGPPFSGSCPQRTRGIPSLKARVLSPVLYLFWRSAFFKTCLQYF